MSRGGRDEVVVIGTRDALIVADVQRDFCPGGSLGVPDGDEVIPVINRLLPLFGHWVYTRDWHPADHVSFSANPEFRDGSWPPHALQGTPGAEWCPGLEMPENAILVSKGDNPKREAYSAFEAEGFDLPGYLHQRNIERLFLTGLATDYCVRETALDAHAAGFTVYLVEDAVRGIAPETTAQALAEVEAAGVRRVLSAQVRGSGERLPAPAATPPGASERAPGPPVGSDDAAGGAGSGSPTGAR
ncbi:MAG: hypothetical protein A2W26_01790 [Acidobacteria bacterium RBG_16_64_8]|nr:MAG: hypothetical protein A2W26_01790 [Acidobacteria bacterium RBG_16_64_8]